MRDPDTEALVEQLVEQLHGELELDRAGGGGPPGVVSCLVVAALLTSTSGDLLRAARRVATATADRQFVAIADAYLRGDHDRVDALARDHLLDHPSRPVLAWILARSRSAGEPSNPGPT